MSKSITLGLVCAGAILLAILLTGCSGTPEPTPLSLDEYLMFCTTTDVELADDATFGDFSSLIAAEADRLDALTPPAQLSEWHLLTIESFRTIQAVVDIQPKDDVIDFGSFLLIAAASADLEEKLSEAAARLPEDIRQQMIEADCILPEDVSDDFDDVPDDFDDVLDDFEDVPDDHGNDIDDATVAAVAVDVEGVIDYEGDPDYFHLIAERGQFYQIDVALGSLPDSVLVLLGPDGWELAYNDDHGDSWASRIFWEAPESGDYYLVVEARESADVGTYTLTVSHSTIVDDHGNDIYDATEAAVAVDVEGVIDYEDDYDYFRFTAVEGRLYQIDVRLGTLDDSAVNLYDGDGSFLDSNDDHGDSLASRIVWEAPAWGDYYLEVFGYGVGSYTLTVSHSTIVDDYGDDLYNATIVDDHGDDLYNATEAPVAVDVEGVIDYEYDYDYFRFTAEDGRFYQIDVGLRTLDDSVLVLLGPDGLELTFNDDYGDSPASRIFWEAPASGDYYLVVRGFASGSGSYTLTVSHSTIVDDYGDDIDDSTIVDDHGNDIYDATVAPVAVDVEGVINSQYDSDYFRFTAVEGRLYQIDVRLGTLDDSGLLLLGPDGLELTFNDDYGDSLASRIFWEAPESGAYYLEVRGYDVGSYTLTVSLPTDDIDDGTIVDDHGDDIYDATVAPVGVDVEGVINYEYDSDYFRFTAEEGRLYQIDVSLGTLENSAVYLYDGDGWFLYHNDDHGDSLASRIFWLAPASGDYYLEVLGHDGAGSYTLTISHSTIVDDHGNDVEEATVVEVAVDVEGVIDYSGDFDYFRFTAVNGRLYQIDVSLGTLDNSFLTLLGPDGRALTHNDDNGDSLASRIFWLAPASGDYYLEVEANVWSPGWRTEVGSYTLTVTRP